MVIDLQIYFTAETKDTEKPSVVYHIEQYLYY